MRLIKYIFAAALPLLSMVGCGDWLNVTPKAQVGIDRIFSNEQGYEDVLIGCYTSMTKSSMYGGNMTFGALDVLAQYYETDDQAHLYNEMAKYVYTGKMAENVINSTWLDSYYTIANCNILLDHLMVADKNLFVKGHRDFIEAEARAIRAYVHFDLLRIFAPSWAAGADKLAIPYADTFQSTPFKQLTTGEVVDKIIKDLERGRELLKEIDPVFEETFKNRIYHFTQPVGDGRSEFLDFRAWRMNYFAITATLARVYQYKGDKVKAYECAKEVIDNKDRFAFTAEGEFGGEPAKRNVNMINEILCCLSHSTVYKIFMFQYNNDAKTACYLYGQKQIYTFPDDLRLYCMIENATTKKISSLKFTELEESNGGKIPLIRISEMFFIASESIYEKDPQLACDYINEVRVNRGVLKLLTPDMTYDNFVKELTLEFRREFFSEGQLFYRYKRLGGNVLRGNAEIEMTPANYILPLPATEVEFGDYKFE